MTSPRARSAAQRRTAVSESTPQRTALRPGADRPFAVRPLLLALAAAVVLAACAAGGDEASSTSQPVGSTITDSSVAEVADEINSSAVMSITSPAVVDGALLAEFQCEQKDADVEASIPLMWTDIPDEATSVAIAMHHYPNPDDTTRSNSYLTLWDIDPSVSEIAYGAAGEGDWFQGSNKDGTAISYTSPCSQDTSAVHEYTITLYALSRTPESLPAEDSLTIDRDALVASLESITVLEATSLTFTTGQAE